MGTGEKCFEAVAGGQEVPLMSGPQGGYHMWLAVGCVDCAATVHLKYGARDPATNMPLTGTYDEEAMVPLKGKDWPQGRSCTCPALAGIGERPSAGERHQAAPLVGGVRRE